MLYDILYYFMLFFAFSVTGWIIETIWCHLILKEKGDRGFLIGPYCPIYGVGGILIYLLLNKYKGDILVLFISAVVICSVVEYLTSFLMEKIFKARWWDYSNQKFNINGRVSLANSVLFGLAGVAEIYVLYPLYSNLFNKIPNNVFIIIAFVIIIIFIIDVVISVITVYKLKLNLKSIYQDATYEIKKLLGKQFGKTLKVPKFFSFLGKRLLKAFPDFKLVNNSKAKIKKKK